MTAEYRVGDSADHRLGAPTVISKFTEASLPGSKSIGYCDVLDNCAGPHCPDDN